MRQLKFHERKLLKKVDFLQWKSENNHRELEVGLGFALSCRFLSLYKLDIINLAADHASLPHTRSRRLQEV